VKVLPESNVALAEVDDGSRVYGARLPERSGERSELDPRIYWRVLMKHRWMVLAGFLAVTLLSTLYTLHKIRMYEATGRIVINKEDATALGFRSSTDQSGDDWDIDAAMETQVRILESDSLIAQVIRQVHLDQKSAFMGEATKAETPSPIVDGDVSPVVLTRFRKSYDVQRIPRTRIIEVHFLSSDPRLAAQVVNAVESTFIEQAFKRRYEATMQVSDWLGHELTDLKLKVETSQAKLVAFQQEHNILGLDEKQNIVTSKLEQLNKELTDAQSDRIRKEASNEIVRSGSADMLPSGVQDVTLQKLREQEADLKRQYAEKTTMLGLNHPTVVQLTNQIKENQSAIAAELGRLGGRAKNEYIAAARRETMLQAALAAQKVEANKLNQASIEYNILNREVESNRKMYEGLLEKLKEAGVSAGFRSSNISVVDSARVPVKPASPNVPRDISIGAVLGLIFGVALAFTIESVDQTIRSADDVESVTGLPILGVLPNWMLASASGKGSGRALPAGKSLSLGTSGQLGAIDMKLVTVLEPKSHAAESFRAIRTSILLSQSGGPPKVLLVSSPMPEEGKTTVSANVAVAIAQRGARVLLIDGDLRRPTVHTRFRVRQRPGLSELLTSDLAPENAIVKFSMIENLHILPSGTLPPHPAELLGSRRMSQLLKQFAELYDHVIIDTPPIVMVTDGVLLSVETDGVVLVTRSGRTTRQALMNARRLLASVNAHVVGVVVNGVDFRYDGYGYGYGYGYGGYGKGTYYGHDQDAQVATRSDGN
jgi:polysaccharide biosynthesis transport protein